ncbi:MAG: preprotein translocase subunit SecE [Pseudomonadota bacterium]
MAANPFKFIQEVRQETSKVTWPTRRETVISTIMVLIMVVIAATFFFAVDQIFSLIFNQVFGL